MKKYFEKFTDETDMVKVSFDILATAHKINDMKYCAQAKAAEFFGASMSDTILLKNSHVICEDKDGNLVGEVYSFQLGKNSRTMTRGANVCIGVELKMK